jgi:hypothetical protein
MDDTKPESLDAVALGETLASQTGGGSLDMPAPATGAARYVRGRELGRGGMGRVYEAVDQQFSRTVAVKQVADDVPNEALRRRFATEALVTGNLEHPGIPAVYERGFDRDGRPFYAMRRVQGRTLAQRLADADTRDKRLALLAIVTRVAQTIGFAHDRGVIHRDLKPDNILVGDHGETFVLDWGLARVRGLPIDATGTAMQSDGATIYGAVVGTPAYMAPEQAAGDLDRIDERTDVFALGGLLYHVLTGAAPYHASSVDALIEVARGGRLAPISEPGLPAELIAICHRATAREPADRYRNAHELARALEDFEAASVLGRPSRTVERVVDVVMGATLLAACYGVYKASQMASSLAEQGQAARASLIIGAIGCLLSLVEWRTRGRYRLGTAGFGFALATVFIALAGAANGIGQVFHHLAAPEVVADAESYRQQLAIGIYELIGGLATGSAFAAGQLALWAVARRRSSDRGTIV